MSVTVYVDGEIVADEEIGKIEITNETAKQIIAQAIKRKEKEAG